MDQGQQAGVVTAVYLLVVAAGAGLYVRGSASGRRQWGTLDSRQRTLLVVCLVGWVSWVASTKVVRPWAAAIGIEGHWALAVAPSFIAGIPVTAYVAFILTIARRLKTLHAFIGGAVLVTLLEVIQPWLPNRVFDLFDVIAGICGAAVVAMFLSRHPYHAQRKVVSQDVRE
jgi:hypothetical protein